MVIVWKFSWVAFQSDFIGFEYFCISQYTCHCACAMTFTAEMSPIGSLLAPKLSAKKVSLLSIHGRIGGTQEDKTKSISE